MSMQSLFFNLLKKLDYFSQPIQLSFNEERKFGNYIGGILSLAIYALVISLLFNSGRDLFNRKNPKTSMTSRYQVNSPSINMSELEMYYISYFLTKEFVPFYDPSYF